MERAVGGRGHLSDPNHIDLDEPVSGIRGAVEVTLRPIQDLVVGSPVAVLLSAALSSPPSDRI